MSDDEKTLISQDESSQKTANGAEKTAPPLVRPPLPDPPTLDSLTEASTEKSDPFIGTEFVGKYRIQSVLGRGGMGAVYLAEHTRMQRKVAIKMMLSGMTEDPSLLKRFEQEAQVASKLSHRNAVTLYDFGVDAGTPYLVMEFVQGPTLKERLEENAPLSFSRTLELLEQIGGALAQAHRLGIVHRDLKPDNVVLAIDDTGQECAKILDFGISKLLDTGGEQSPNETDLTKTGIVIGTPKYLSPEQAKGKAVDARSDIYSIGIMTYEMLSGKSPFDAGSVMEVIAMHLHTVPPTLSSLNLKPPISEKVSEVVASALEKDPED